MTIAQWNPVNTVTNRPKKNWPYYEGFFLQENVWPFCQLAKKSGRNSKVTVLPRWLLGGVSLYYENNIGL